MGIDSRNRTELKQYFVKNAIPKEGEFAELIDGMLNRRDDGIYRPPGDPLSVVAEGDSTTSRRLINFYAGFDGPPVWGLSLRPAAEGTRDGLTVSDGEGNPRLFIDRDTGRLGVGTTRPASALHVQSAENRSGITIQSGAREIDQGIAFQDGDGRYTWHVYRGSSEGGPELVFASGVPNADLSKLAPRLTLNAVGNLVVQQSIQFPRQLSQMINLYDQRYGIGIQSATQYFRTAANFAWFQAGSHNDNELNAGGGTLQMALISGNLVVGNKTSAGARLDVDGNIRASGAIVPSAGNASSNGIMFPTNPGRGSGDAAWIRYYARSGEATTFEIGTSDNSDDHIALMPSRGNVGIGINAPTAKLEIAGTSGNVLRVGVGDKSTASIDLSGHVMLKEYSTNGLAYFQARDDGSNRDIGLRIRTQKKGTSSRTLVEALTVSPNGYLGIGIDKPGAPLHVAIRSPSKGKAEFRTAGTNYNQYWSIGCYEWVGAYGFRSWSDARVKRNPVAIDGETALAQVNQLNLVDYEHIPTYMGGGTGRGVFAQELQSVMPEAVGSFPRQELDDGTVIEDFLSVDYDWLFVTGLAAIRELSRQVDELRHRLSAALAGADGRLQE